MLSIGPRLDTKDLLSTDRDGPLEDTLRFWIPREIDRELSGYFTGLDQDGTVSIENAVQQAMVQRREEYPR
jgi:mannose/cellobiose epimerase-like protein (N-acyl-D-glucosamine 2-epimerase family)